MRDITEKRTGDERMQASLREKEILLKEIHHRVKNNLQMIASLLSLQSEYVTHSKAVELLEDMKSRVRSIAAIHEMLYGSADLSRIDFAAYLHTLSNDCDRSTRRWLAECDWKSIPDQCFLISPKRCPAV